METFDPNRAAGTFWVKLPFIGARTSKTIYMYYGNPAAQSLSNGRDTFPLFEDFTTSGWSRRPEMPAPVADAGAAVIKGKFYVIGGYNMTPSNTLGSNFEFDPQTNTYTRKAPMITPRWGAIAVGVGTNIYVFGGSLFAETTPVRMTEVYDTEADSWTPRAPVPEALATEGVTGCTDGVSVFLFAHGAGFRYDVGTDSYTPLGVLPHYVGNWASCGYYKGRIFVVGGFSYDRDVENTTQIYDIKTNQWSLGHPMPFAVYGAVRENPVVGDTMYILQGQRMNGEFSSQAYAYNLLSDSWSDRSLGPHAEDGVAGGVYDNKVFSFGGRQDVSGPYGLNYASVYDPTADHGSAWAQVTGGFETRYGDLRRMVPLRGSTDVRAPGLSELQTVNFQTPDNFVLEARTNSAFVAGRRDVSKTSWNSIGVETDPGSYASGLGGCQIPVNDHGTSSSLTRFTTLQPRASVWPAATGVQAYSLARADGNLVLAENGHPVLDSSDRSCRSGRGFLSIQTGGENSSSWSKLFVRAYSVIEPRVIFPPRVG
jgi:N-acetylneuraminic acid mutarotase